MRYLRVCIVLLSGYFLVGLLETAAAQGVCRAPANGTVPACGTSPGYFRPQPWTLNRNFVPQRTPPGSYYAPIGPNQKNWQQYNSQGYGPVEPNPYGNNGVISPPRTAKHLWETRVKPAAKRRGYPE